MSDTDIRECNGCGDNTCDGCVMRRVSLRISVPLFAAVATRIHRLEAERDALVARVGQHHNDREKAMVALAEAQGYRIGTASVPPTVCPHCGKPWGPEHHDWVPAIGYEDCRPATPSEQT